MSVSLSQLSFEDSVKDFQVFLESLGAPTDLLWAFREDFRWSNKSIFLKAPIAGSNESLAKKLYEIARFRGLGVRFNMFALLDERSLCYVDIPGHEKDYNYAMKYRPDKLVMVKNCDPAIAQVVDEEIFYRVKKEVHFDNVPTKKLILNLTPPEKFSLKGSIAYWREKSKIKKLLAIS